jgi:exopolysaccharide production protein ExoQ
MHQIAKRPLTGFGYGAVWDSTSFWGPLPEISKEQGFTVHEAHNTWLAVWLELGYIGLAGWVLLFVSVWVRAIGTLFVGAGAYFALPVLAVFSLHSVTESVALGQNDLTWLVFSALAVKLATGERAQPPASHRSVVQLDRRRRAPARAS